MIKKMYDLNKLSMPERKEIFEKDPKNYMYSIFHEIVDKAFDFTESYEDQLPHSFDESFSFEVITQVLNFVVTAYGFEDTFERLHLIEQEFKSLDLLRPTH